MSLESEANKVFPSLGGADATAAEVVGKVTDRKLPRGWLKERLAKLIEPRRERVAPSAHPHLPFLGMDNVEAHTTKILGTISAHEVKSSSARFYSGDVLYGRLRPYLNKVARPDFQGIASAEFIVFPDTCHLRSAYLQYRLNARDFVTFASRLNAGDRPRVDFEQIGEFIVELPPEPEQRRIIAKIEELFSDLDAGVAALERARANLKRYRAAVLKAAVEGKLTEQWRRAHPDVEPASKLLERILAERRKKWEETQLAKYAAAGKTPPNGWKEKYPEPVSPDSSGISDIPEGWCIGSLDQLCSHITSGSRDWTRYYGRGNGVFVMAQNVRPGRLDLSSKQFVDPPMNSPDRERSRILKGDLLVTIVGANTGDTCPVPDEYSDHFVCQSVSLLRPVQPEFTKYLSAYLNSPENGRRQFERYIYGQGRPHLSFEQLRMTAIVIPPLDEQRAIVSELENRLSVIEHMKTEIGNSFSRTSKLRQAILNRAFEGKLVPQDANDEPASVLLERIRAERAASAPPARNGRAKRTRAARHSTSASASTTPVRKRPPSN